MSSNRSFKRDLLSSGDDGAMSDQPAVKSRRADEIDGRHKILLCAFYRENRCRFTASECKFAHGEEEQRLNLLRQLGQPAEILDLQQKVIDLQERLFTSEKNLQVARRETAEAKDRIQFVEILLDSKPKSADGAKKNGREGEMEKKVNDLTAQLDQERVTRLKDRHSISVLTLQLADERRRISENRMRDQARIDELTARLAQYEGRRSRINYSSSNEELPQPSPIQKMLQPPQRVVELQQPQPALKQQLQRPVMQMHQPLKHQLEPPLMHHEHPSRQQLQPALVQQLQPSMKQQLQLPLMQKMQQPPKNPEQPPLMEQPEHVKQKMQQPAVQLQPAALDLQQEEEEGEVVESEDVTIRANFTGISDLTCEKVCSEPTEFAGVTWTMSLYKTHNTGKFDVQFCLEGENEHVNAWECPVWVELQFYSQKSDELVCIRSAKKFYGAARRALCIASFPFEKLEEDGYVIDDSIMVAATVRVLPTC